MINEPLVLPNNDNQGIAPLGFQKPQTTPLPDFGQIARNVIKNKAIDYVGKKVGLPALGTVLGLGQSFVNPLGLAAFGPAGLGIGALQNINQSIQGSTFGRSATIADFLAAKRTQKAIARDEKRDLQDRINKGQFGTVTPQDAARGNQYEGGGGGMSANASTGTSAERGAALHG